MSGNVDCTPPDARAALFVQVSAAFRAQDDLAKQIEAMVRVVPLGARHDLDHDT
jgi:hypothetical protein